MPQELTKEWVLDKFREIVESDANWGVKVRALELLGKYFNMFISQSKVNIDVRQLLMRASTRDLERIAGNEEKRLAQGGSDDPDWIDADVCRVQLPPGDSNGEGD